MWAGLEDFYKCLGRSLEDECVRRQGLVGGVEVLRVPKRESTKVSSSVAPATHVPVPRISLCATPAPTSCNERTVWCVLGALTVLLLLNAFLYYKLFAMENLNTEPQLESILDARMFGWESGLCTSLIIYKTNREDWTGLFQAEKVKLTRDPQV